MWPGAGADHEGPQKPGSGATSRRKTILFEQEATEGTEEYALARSENRASRGGAEPQRGANHGKHGSYGTKPGQPV